MIALFAITAHTSAFLLFWVEPLFASLVLPLLGGSPAVWNTCLTPTSFDGDAGSWGLALAGVYEVEGDHVLLGVALAYAGRKDAGIRAGERAVVLDSSQSQQARYYQHQLARIYILVGEQEKALDRLEPLLRKPYYLSPGWLKIDPTFDPLRNNPRFKRLVDAPVPAATH
jgi:hypothetical protein